MQTRKKKIQRKKIVDIKEESNTSSSRTIWRGAISFGLAHIPVAMHAASVNQSVDFDWLDKRTGDPVGYKRINKRTGKEISAENVVKGIKLENEKYAVLSTDEIKSALPVATQTIDIEQFIDVNELPFLFYERPYYLVPGPKADKVYVLLWSVLKESGKIGIAKIVMQNKQHLAMLSPCGKLLALDLIRWENEIRQPNEAPVIPSVKINAAELKMARQLVDSMAGEWAPEKFTDTFRDQIFSLVAQKVKKGKLMTQPESGDGNFETETTGSNVIDLTALLKKSLENGFREKASSKKESTSSLPSKARSDNSPTKKIAAKKPIRGKAVGRSRSA